MVSLNSVECVPVSLSLKNEIPVLHKNLFTYPQWAFPSSSHRSFQKIWSRQYLCQTASDILQTLLSTVDNSCHGTQVL